jgi:hypothetical protein
MLPNAHLRRLRTPLKSAAAVIIGVVVAMTAATSAAAAPTAAPAGAVGSDLSYPQCGSQLGGGGTFGIVGLNNGRPWSLNPCFSTQYSWAKSRTYSAGIYLNTANPAPTSSYFWPKSGTSDPALCRDSSSTTDPGCAYDYGWHAAADALSKATAADSSITALTWWLDIETANSWNGDGTSNAADLQGMADYLRSHGVSSVGLYSTSYQWKLVTGGYTSSSAAQYKSAWKSSFTPQYPLETAPLWIAGLGTVGDATNACSTSFTGTPARLAQYVDAGADADLVCGKPPTVGKPSAPRNLTATTYRGGVTLSWMAPASTNGAPITSYTVLRSTTSGAEQAYATVTCSTTSCSWKDPSTAPGKTYFYQLVAVNTAGSGPPSNEVRATAR